MKRITVSQLYYDLLSGYLKKLDEPNLQKSDEVAEGERCQDAYKKRIDQTEIEKLIEAIEKRTGNLSFGLKIGEHIHPTDYGTVGYALMTFSTLHQALNFTAEHKYLLNEAFTTQLVRKGTRYHYQTLNVTANRNLAALVELDFSSAIQMAKFFVGAQKSAEVKLIQVNFQHKALGDLENYQRIFNCPVHFEQRKNELIISKRILDMPIRSANPQILNLMLRKIERWKKEFLTNSSFSQKVISYISSQKEANIPSISSVAKEFNISVSTLKKRLKQEDLNYSTLCDAIKKNLALKMIASSATQIKEIYIKLDFANSSSFNRAFKRWTNMTPTEYRSRKVENEDQSSKQNDE